MPKPSGKFTDWTCKEIVGFWRCPFAMEAMWVFLKTHCVFHTSKGPMKHGYETDGMKHGMKQPGAELRNKGMKQGYETRYETWGL